MTDIREQAIEAGAQALVGGTNYVMSGDPPGFPGTMNRLTATFVVDAVLPIIQGHADATHMCSRAVDDYRDHLLEQVKGLRGDDLMVEPNWNEAIDEVVALIENGVPNA
jgi:hypothetical protein